MSTDSPDYSTVFNIAPHLAGDSRSHSAPPYLNLRSPALEEVSDADDPRFSAEYSHFYYSMTPRDPRLPPPFVSTRQWASMGPVNLSGFRNSQTSASMEEDIEDESLKRSISTLSIDMDDEESSVPNTPDDAYIFSPFNRNHRPPSNFKQQVPAAPKPSTTPLFQPDPSRSVPQFSTNAPPFSPKRPLPSTTTPTSTANSLLSPQRANTDRYKGMTISHFVGSLDKLCCDQHGSRFIQERLDEATDEEKEMVFTELRPVLLRMALEPFGNYVIQKFFSVGLPIHIEELVNMLKGRILDLTLQMYGCRVVQKAFTSLSPDVLLPLVHELRGSVWGCIRDQNGNHVIQCAVETVSKINPKELDFLIEAVTGSCGDLASHAYGCRVIQRILEHCTKEQISPLIDELLLKSRVLVNDQYGNYVCQHIIQFEPEASDRLFDSLRGTFVELARQKFSSNVVEQMCRYLSKKHVEVIAREFLKDDEVLPTLMRDPFGNFVIQKVVNAADARTRRDVVEAAKRHVLGPQRFKFGRFITSFFSNM
ncbi:hypothetical protein RCL1_005436 [Eukaryota sp. TZLM3-RCL]